ncbi:MULTISPECIES: hypothetical protein [Streptomyces]|uniref:Uncharacterized protein n=1 Tax=Streptomyces changanensis TaxID=2964669 RepID=A0ABY5NAC4_9ACTN|nr:MULTISPECIES: hypothetical protein [Streptomyces]UUS32958.1 hypothetical protein NRO40_20470 [Streptomyces changanensis]
MAFWCTGAAALGFAPSVPSGVVVLSGGGGEVSTSGLVVFALYRLGVVIVGAYPFEKIRSLGRSGER